MSNNLLSAWLELDLELDDRRSEAYALVAMEDNPDFYPFVAALMRSAAAEIEERRTRIFAEYHNQKGKMR